MAVRVASNAAGTVGCSIDLEAPGKRVGHLDLNWSDDDHAYGVIPVPIAVVVGAASGPTVLLTAGNHGDEYEGQVILRRVLAAAEPETVRGRLIVMPALNLPAVRARARTSPIDGGNMNRAFPGDPASGPTAMIAHFVEGTLLPAADHAVDIHSGGTASIYVPCGYVYRGGNAAFMARKLESARRFAAPFTALVAGGAGGSLSAAAERQDVEMISCELGGGARIDPTALAIGWHGVRALLDHWGVLAAGGDAPLPEPATRFVETEGRRSHVMAPIDGVVEPVAEVGDGVTEGDLAAIIHPTDDLTRPPVEVRFAASGIVLARRTMPMVVRGDTLCHTGRPVEA